MSIAPTPEDIIADALREQLRETQTALMLEKVRSHKLGIRLGTWAITDLTLAAMKAMAAGDDPEQKESRMAEMATPVLALIAYCDAFDIPKPASTLAAARAVSNHMLETAPDPRVRKQLEEFLGAFIEEE